MSDHARLIVNADDYGLTPGVSAGIRAAHLAGIVTCTTVMMVFAQVEDDLRLAQAEAPQLGIGVHLVVSEYTPVRPAQTVRSLIGPDGRFHSPATLYGEHGPSALERFDPAELRDEWRAQIERFLGLHMPLDHLDCHHHVAYFAEHTFSVLRELAREYAVPIRIPVSMRRANHGERWQIDERGRFDWLASQLPGLDLRHPDNFLGNFYDQTATVADLLAILSTLPVGASELMCHPGYVDTALRAITSYHEPRADEISALTDERVRPEIAKRNIERISFAQL